MDEELILPEPENEFETQLRELFPDIWKIHCIGKNGEAHIWEVIAAMLEFQGQGQSGTLYIHYNKGHIDGLDAKIDKLAFKKYRPGY